MNKARIALYVTLSVVVLAGLIYLWSINLIFILASELDIDTTTDNYSFSVLNGDEINMSFKTTIKAPSTCSSVCTFTLREVSSNKTIFFDEERIASSYKTTVPYVVEETDAGEVYLAYDTVCRNVKSAFCSTQEEPYYETAFITVHHNQTSQQQNTQNYFKEQLEFIELTLETSRLFLEEFAHYTSVINTNASEFQNQREQQLILLSTRDDLIERVSVQKNMWKQGLYYQMSEEELDALQTAALDLEEESFIQKNNSLALIDALAQTTDLLNQVILTQEQLNYLLHYDGGDSYGSFVNKLYGDLNESVYALSAHSYESIAQLQDDVAQLNEEVQTLVAIYDDLFATASQETQYATRLWVQNTPASFDEICEDLTTSATQITQYNQKVNELLTTNYSSLLSNESFVNWSQDYATALYENESFNDTSFSYEFLVPYDMRWSQDLSELHQEYCLNTTSEVLFSPVAEVEVPDYNASQVQLEELTLDPTDCCLYGECSSTCTPDHYPIVFVHGHSITSVTSPEAALHAFSKIQRLLEGEGFVNVGELDDYPQESWISLQFPLSVRISYYYVTYVELGQYHFYSNKYESIENYAIRLKELVDEVKEKTGQDKVVIVAHSMGGLVTRQYLYLFGEESVEKAILIGTPNHGVFGASQDVCGLIGSDRECADMAQDSVFLKKLNSFKPTKTKMYTIAAGGCPKYGYDGDGVVTVDSVYLEYADNTVIEGECTDALQSDLHRTIINPDKYPQVYERVVEILQE